MPDAEKLCVVDDVLFIKGRGLVASTSLWQGITVKVNDWIDLRSADGTTNFAKIKSIDMMRWPSTAERVMSVADRYVFTLAHIDRNSVHAGDEVWSVVELPAEFSQRQ